MSISFFCDLTSLCYVRDVNLDDVCLTSVKSRVNKNCYNWFWSGGVLINLKPLFYQWQKRGTSIEIAIYLYSRIVKFLDLTLIN